MAAVSLVWYRQDLRVDDHAALSAAATRGGVAAVYVWSPDEEGDWPPGAAARVWIDRALHDLDASLRRLDARLTVRAGAAADELTHVARHVGADVVYALRRYEPAAIRQENCVGAALKRAGIELRLLPGALLFDPDEVRTTGGGPFKVFTPFHRRCMAMPQPDEPMPAPARLQAPPRQAEGMTIDALRLRPQHDWPRPILAAWDMTERAAHECLAAFIAGAAADYDKHCDRPDRDATSRLSPYLHHGQISVRRIWHALRQAAGGRIGQLDAGRAAWLRQLLWREFAHHLLVHFPHLPTQPLRQRFAAFPWRCDDAALKAWQRGRTGYPLVDAGMRQLWATGWMHNRARMVVGSFLVKDLLLHWRQGAAWFWDALVDADLANNTLGWQWIAGCGADAAPYFRIFNPVRQARKFDPAGAYVRRWVTELADTADAEVFEPGVRNGETGTAANNSYPDPIVDHHEARGRALDALARVSGAGD